MFIMTCSATDTTLEPETYRGLSNGGCRSKSLMLYLKNLNLVINRGVQINMVRTNTCSDTQLQIPRLQEMG